MNHATQGRMDQLERGVGARSHRGDAGGGSAPGGARRYQIRIPDPKSWNLTALKNGETGFLPWRKSVELQVRVKCASLDHGLESLREEIVPVDRTLFERRVTPADCSARRQFT